jgi:cation transport regulator ChaB
MPWSSNKELPKHIRDKYDSKGETAFRKAANSVLEAGGDEGKAFRVGHTVAKRVNEKPVKKKG